MSTCKHCGNGFKVGDLPQRVNKPMVNVKAQWVHLYCQGAYLKGGN